MRPRPGYVLAELTEKLNLAADQQKTIGAIIRNGQSQMRDVHGDDSLSKEDRRAKMREIMASTHDQIRAALTADQQKLFDAMPPGGARPKQPDNN
jgi:phage shock protein A